MYPIECFAPIETRSGSVMLYSLEKFRKASVVVQGCIVRDLLELRGIIGWI
jgi:hypothetical protein